jgi:UDP-N-acetylmuramate--alanine ligase
MFKIDFNTPIKAHFIGIGGISMSGLAELLHTLRFEITGSDAKASTTTDHLEELGITVFYGQRPSNITNDVKLVVYTTAVKENNPELMAARELGIPVIDRADLLGQIMKCYTDAIAVSGTHGKTTTTSMISLLLLDAGLDPTVSVGGILDGIGGNIRIGNSEHFVTEACEYTNSFLKFSPTTGIILNIEEEHLDFFKDLSDIRNSFKTFTDLLPNDGLLVINADIENISFFTDKLNCPYVTYSTKEESSPVAGTKHHYYAGNIHYDANGFGQYSLYEDGALLGEIHLHVVGDHNISNSLPAVAVARNLNIPLTTIQESLSRFTGTKRRFEYKGTIAGVTVIDDYAHHPTEVTATLNAAKNYPHSRVWCVFQPHTYTRTRSFLKEFAESLSLADKIVLTDIYAARELDPGDISSKDLEALLKEKGKDVIHISTFDEIQNYLLENCTNGDLLITMGAGDVVTIGNAILGL